MNWQQLIAETIDGIAVYAILRSAFMAVEVGKATETQKNLVDNFKQLLSEYKSEAVLKEMKAESADIVERERKFKAKWGVLPSGHV